jgi:DNA-binding protein H-NS
MSTSYHDYQKQIAELQAKAEEARRSEVAAARAQIKSIMDEYDITLADLGGTAKQASKTPRKPVEVKYRDETTGETWTGRGRAPKWLEGKDKNAYLVR